MKFFGRILVVAIAAAWTPFALPAAPASAAPSTAVCSPYLVALSPLFGTLGGTPQAWGQVKLKSDGYPCVGRTITVCIQRKIAYTSSWGTYGCARYLSLPRSELGAVLQSLPIARSTTDCRIQYRTKWVMDGLAATGPIRNAC